MYPVNGSSAHIIPAWSVNYVFGLVSVASIPAGFVNYVFGLVYVASIPAGFVNYVFGLVWQVRLCVISYYRVS